MQQCLLQTFPTTGTALVLLKLLASCGEVAACSSVPHSAKSLRHGGVAGTSSTGTAEST